MRIVALLVEFSAIVCSLPGPVRAQAGGSTPLVVIRSYNTFSDSMRELEIAREVAERVFRKAGIDARWRECRTAMHRSAPDRCEDLLGPDEVVVRVLRSPAGSGSTATLGHSPVGALGAHTAGVLATVFGDCVQIAAARAGRDPAVLLGRAVAHEVGHLLFGTPEHSARGLMRARWSDDELTRDRERDWIFSTRQAARLREALIVRRADRSARRLSPP